MPTYEYRCDNTGEQFDIYQSFTDDALTICPVVHGDDSEPCGALVKKVFGKVGVSFKGSGFYKTDNRKPEKSSASQESSGSGSTAGSDSKSSGASSSDTKSSGDSSSKSSGSNDGGPNGSGPTKSKASSSSSSD